MNKPATTSFSYSALWDDTARMVRAHSAILLALAGVFIFLPNLLSAYFIPLPPGRSIAEMVNQMSLYMERNWHWQLLLRLVNSLGAISIILVLIGREASTVGGAISRGSRLLPAFFLILLCSDLMLFLGLVLFFIPFLYLFGRLSVLGPVVVAEGRTGPLDAIRRSFAVTRGFGWAAVGLVAIIFLLGMLLGWVVTIVLGTILVLIFGQALGGFMLLIVGSAVSAALATILTVLYVAIYRRLAGGAQPTVPSTRGI